MTAPSITNALIRCTRKDRVARSHFELVRPDLGLWVCELPEEINALTRTLSEMETLLETLSEGSTDYTLHLSIAIDLTSRLIIPPPSVGIVI